MEWGLIIAGIIIAILFFANVRIVPQATEYVIEMTGDNVGPHLPSAVKRILKRYPDAKVQSGTLNDLAKKLLKNIDSYPSQNKYNPPNTN